MTEAAELHRLYGSWDPLTPADVATAMAGFPRPWWIAGGFAIEAFTGVARPHDDLDLVVFADAIDAVRRQFAGRFDLWSVDDGAMRPLDDRHLEPLNRHGQIWMRVDARSPWRVDCLLNPVVAGRWQSKRDPAFVADLDDVTWIAADGVRYLNPEITLLFKAKSARPKDDRDLEVTWPRLSDWQQTWLRAATERLHPGHRWLASVVAGTGAPSEERYADAPE